MRPLYIFDLDGTLALTEHRQHFIDGPKKDWKAFFAACVDDKPNIPVIVTLKILRDSGADIWIFSGRSDEVREESVAWIAKYVQYNDGDRNIALQMRAAGDYTPDDVLKAQWLENLSPQDRMRLVAVFDDRDKVVAMWRSKGIPCFQVAPGGF